MGVALIALFIAWTTGMGTDNNLFLTFSLSMCFIPIASLRNLRLGAMRGLHRVVISLIPEMVLAPLLLLILIGTTYFVLDANLTSVRAMGMRLIATGITLIVGFWLLNKSLPTPVKRATPQYKVKNWVKGALPFILLDSIYIIHSRTDILMLGALEGTESAGIYVPVSRGVQFLAFVLMAVDSVLAPTIAGLYAENQLQKLQRVITKSARAAVLVSLPIAIGLAVFSYQFLSLFGPGFTVGQTALIIFCVGHVANTSIGSAGWLLNMTGNERYTAICDAVAVLLNVVLNALLIPKFGVNGAALATVTSLLLKNSFNMFVARTKLNLNPAII